MRVDKPYYFECLRCGTEAQLATLAPRCPKCNSGNGIVTERGLPEPLPIKPDPVAQAMTI